MKEALGSGRKPDLTNIRTPLMVYGSRACEYGSVKYERANFLRATGDGPHSEPTPDDLHRLRTYLRAVMSHTMATLDAIERHQANDPKLADVAGMKRAAFAEDTDPDTSGKVGPSCLPHLCGAVASLNMGIAQAVDCGLLPADPGQQWVEHQQAKPVTRESGESRVQRLATWSEVLERKLP